MLSNVKQSWAAFARVRLWVTLSAGRVERTSGIGNLGTPKRVLVGAGGGVGGRSEPSRSVADPRTPAPVTPVHA